MPRTARKGSPSNMYHVTMRGVGRQLIFEDDADRRAFLRKLGNFLEDETMDCLSWCLMDNHVHLLLESELPALSSAMQKLETRYASRFNARHDRVGHLFQGRFGSEPVLDERQLLVTIRYIHLNPTKAYGIPVGEYRWSSYSEFMRSSASIVNRDRVLSLFGDVGRFAAFHEQGDADGEVSSPPMGRISNAEAACKAAIVLGERPASTVKSLPKSERNEILRRLRSEGLSIKQIERLTSIGRNIIARAK